MSDHFHRDDIYFESEPELNFDFTSKSIKNDSQQADQQRQSNPSVSLNTVGQKNKYINRIKSMGPIQTLVNSTKVEKQKEDDKSLDKKERNKMAAKNSRDRKKFYIQIMEEKKRNLEKQLESKKRELEESKNYYDRIVSQSKTMSNFAASRHQLIKRLETLLECSQTDPTTEINQIIDNLRSRIGATGKQRINTINQYFRQIVNLSLPALHRYMMWSAADKRHLFSEDEEREAEQQEWFKELKNALNLTEEQKKQIKNKQLFLSEQKRTLQGLIEELREVKDEIESKSIELDDIIDGIRKILTPVQCAHFILFIQKNKYRKQLNLCDPSNCDEHPPRKMVKRQ